MNDKLQEALLNILNNVTHSVENGVSFLSEQLPDVIHQLLLWKAVESGIHFGVLMALCIGLGIAAYKFLKAGKEYKPKNSYDDDAFGYFILFGVSLFLAGVSFVFASNQLEWLKILIAPKMYLIEYAAQLVKGH